MTSIAPIKWFKTAALAEVFVFPGKKKFNRFIIFSDHFLDSRILDSRKVRVHHHSRDVWANTGKSLYIWSLPALATQVKIKLPTIKLNSNVLGNI